MRKLAGTLAIIAAILWASIVAQAQAPSQVALPLIAQVPPTLTPTATTAPLPSPTATRTTGPAPFFGDCSSISPPSAAPEYPITIVQINKSSVPETVHLRNLGTTQIDLTGWRMCSIMGSQEHTGLIGLLPPGETRAYPYRGSGNIWNNSERDDGALYDPSGRLISYEVDQ